ncbi:hypothetical protein [Williamsia serinedens]|uniref:Uncharacterized protein n=1 Tax=Williamsia serinedens TaxID=391736 RepID=A0ABT1HB28_9NOCA|nr:hypothetical protein [Williamsia serinedens]MCP2163132.1 hypothetical protein [Williamsia serinedens]
MSDRYDDMSTADLLREVCRKLDRIEKQGDRSVHINRVEQMRATQAHLAQSAVRRPGALCGY